MYFQHADMYNYDIEYETRGIADINLFVKYNELWRNQNKIWKVQYHTINEMQLDRSIIRQKLSMPAFRALRSAKLDPCKSTFFGNRHVVKHRTPTFQPQQPHFLIDFLRRRRAQRGNFVNGLLCSNTLSQCFLKNAHCGNTLVFYRAQRISYFQKWYFLQDCHTYPLLTAGHAPTRAHSPTSIFSQEMRIWVC